MLLNNFVDLFKNKSLAIYLIARFFGTFTLQMVSVAIGWQIYSLTNSIFMLGIVALIILGGSDVISVVIRSTLVQIETPDAMRGRVNSINQLFIGTSNQLGEFESGITASLFGAMPAALIGGIGTVVVVFLWIQIFPSLYHINEFNYDGR